MRKAMQAPKLRSTGTTTSDTHHEEIEVRGNPIYSPEDSLAKAASKLAHLKASAAAAPPSTSTLAPTTTTPYGSQHPNDASTTAADATTTPGWHPAAAETSREDVPLAARSLISKRNRRKSVYQRPARYGEWFDGDDEELERIVKDEDDDGQTGGKNSKTDGEHASSKVTTTVLAPTKPVAADSEENAGAAARRQQHKERAARRKSAFPALGGGRGMTLHAAADEDAPQQSQVREPSPSNAGSDIADKVRAIADGLCERLDGIIEESPAVKRLRDDRSLRDKLVESWEGRSYYDRLMQMAGADEAQRREVEKAHAFAKKAAAEAAAKKVAEAAQAASAAADAPGTQHERCEDGGNKQEVQEEEEEEEYGNVASFLSPPKPKLRREITSAMANAGQLLPHSKHNQQLPAPQPQKPGPQQRSKEKPPMIAVVAPVATQPPTHAGGPSAPTPSIDVSKLLLKVSSARGPKPSNPAPWEEAGTKPEATGVHPNNLNPSPAPQGANVAKPSAAVVAPDVEKELLHEEVLRLRAALAEAEQARAAIVEEVTASQRKEMEILRCKLEEAEETAVAEAEAHKATEKRMAALEAEVASYKVAAAAAEAARGSAKDLHK
jgi:hypothetical protein